MPRERIIPHMRWEYIVEEVSPTASTETIEDQLMQRGSSEWEAVSSWAVPGDPHVNQGAWRILILFKKPVR